MKPWANGPEQEEIRRQYIQERYKLPCLTSTQVMEEGNAHRPAHASVPVFPRVSPTPHQTGQSDSTVPIWKDASGEFNMVGPDLLVAAYHHFWTEWDDYDARTPIRQDWYDFLGPASRMGDVKRRQFPGALQPDGRGGPDVSNQFASIPSWPTLPVFFVSSRGHSFPAEPLGWQSTEEKPQGPLTLPRLSRPAIGSGTSIRTTALPLHTNARLVPPYGFSSLPPPLPGGNGVNDPHRQARGAAYLARGWKKNTPSKVNGLFAQAPVVRATVNGRQHWASPAKRTRRSFFLYLRFRGRGIGPYVLHSRSAGVM